MKNWSGLNTSNFFSLFSLFLILLGSCTFSLSVYAVQRSTLTLASSEASPFSSVHDPKQGYVNEVIHLTFEKIGFIPNVEFFPHARAVYLADGGQVEGVFPLRDSTARVEGVIYSDAIRGGSINYLIHNNRNVKNLTNRELDDSARQFTDLGFSRLGALRGAQLPVSLREAENIDVLLAKSLPTLLDMLDKGRVDFIYIDEYSAKQTITNHRPHLAQKFKFIKALRKSNPHFLGISKKLPNAQEIITRFNQALASLEADGTIDSILKRYGIFNEVDDVGAQKKLIVGVPNINGIDTAIRYLNDSGSPFPELSIQWRIMEESILRKQILGDFAVNETQFDLIMLGNFEVPIWARNGWLLPFSAPPSNYDMKDIIPIAKQSNTFRGETYGLPFVGETTLTFYRKDLLQNAGISLPEQMTYKNLSAIATLVQNPQSQLYGVGLRSKVGWGQNMALIGTMVNAYGGRWFDEEMKPLLTSKPWEQAAYDYVSLIVNNGPLGEYDLGWKDNQQLFADGKLAFFVDASSLGGYLLDPTSSKVSKNVGVTYAPIGTTRKGAQWFWSWNFAVPQLSQSKVLAQELAYWLTSKAFIASVKSKYGYYAAPAGTRHSTYSDGYINAIPYASYEYKALLATDLDNINVPTIGSQFVPIPEFTALGYLVGVQINLAVKQKITVQEALKTAQQQSEAVMRRAGYYQH